MNRGFFHSRTLGVLSSHPSSLLECLALFLGWLLIAPRVKKSVVRGLRQRQLNFASTIEDLKTFAESAHDLALEGHWLVKAAAAEGKNG